MRSLVSAATTCKFPQVEVPGPMPGSKVCNNKPTLLPGTPALATVKGFAGEKISAKASLLTGWLQSCVA